MVREEVERIEASTAGAVGQVVAGLRDARDPSVVVHARDEHVHAVQPGTEHLLARWWRHVVTRAVTEVPGVEIVTHQG